jgi:ABC-type sugar transport system ATPase subunit
MWARGGNGAGTLLISSELPELLGICDRIIVSIRAVLSASSAAVT